MKITIPTPRICRALTYAGTVIGVFASITIGPGMIARIFWEDFPLRELLLIAAGGWITALVSGLFTRIMERD